jgi:hypothetical protein
MTMKFSIMLMTLALISLGSVACSEERNQDPPGVSEWNLIADQIVIEGGFGPAPAYWALAIVQTSVYEALNAVSGQDSEGKLEMEASVAAAIAAANHTALSALVPTKVEEIANDARESNLCPNKSDQNEFSRNHC